SNCGRPPAENLRAPSGPKDGSPPPRPQCSPLPKRRAVPKAFAPEVALSAVEDAPEAGAPRRSSLARLFAVLAGGNMLATVMKSLAGVLVARLVSPATLGLFNGIGTVQNYVVLAQGGLAQGLTRDLPYHLGRGDRERALHLASI